MESHITEVERNRRKEERKRQKDMYKALETPEQKRARRLEKKGEKERHRKQLMGWDEEYMGYTNDDNPFGDSNLHETFVWGKKYEKLGLKNLEEDKIRQINKEKMIRNKQELEKVKQRRLEREREREERVDEMSRMQREKEAEQFKEWAKQEDYFHLKQAKLRSKLRIKEGRAKPIDILARYINVFGDNILPSQQAESESEEDNSEATSKAKAKHRLDRDEEELMDRIHVLQGSLSEPYNALNGLRIRDMEDLEEDIRIYMELDSGAKTNADYWRDLQIIVEDELAKLKLANMDVQERRREGINPSVSAEIAKILKGKTPQELKALQTQIEKKISSKEEGIDIGYWETMLSRLRAQIARARLREFHEENMKRRSQLISTFKQQLQEIRPSTEDLDVNLAGGNELEQAGPSSVHNDNQEELRFLSAAEMEQKCLQDYRAGQYSPKPIPIEDVNTESLILTLEDRVRELDELRMATLKRLLAFPTPFVQFDSPKGKGKDKASTYDHNARQMTRDEEAFVREARKGMNDDEAIFSVEEMLDGSGPSGSSVSGGILQKEKYSWAEKYRPRKPRYFNRVHTGFEWNKYNQTHYDVDNPPPKVVQGYKFNIFYPDLIDKSSTPSYKITPCPENRDFAYIRFSAGPPYEDICFKIVNREWNYSYKSGFRSQFQNNILQLWFHFKRYRYRR